MSSPPPKIDSPVPRADLVKKAAEASTGFPSAFDWINDKELLRVTNNPANRGLTAIAIRELARDWIAEGGEIKCVKEERPQYVNRRHYHYDITVLKLDGFPRGLYVEMEIYDPCESDPGVNLLSAHPPTIR